MLNQYRIVHANHAGIELGELFPEQLEFGIFLSDIGYVNYNISLENPMARREFTEPEVTDYKLYVGTTVLQGGEHKSFAIDDIVQDYMSVSGQEWKGYLDERIWDFDPTDPSANVYNAFQIDHFQIVRDLITQMMLDPNSLQLTFDDPSALSGDLDNFQILPGDTESIMSKINGLASQQPGFDWSIDLDKVVHLYAPQKGALNSNVIFELGKNIEKLTYQESGPSGTKILGLGSGISSQVGTLLEDSAASAKYRRRDLAANFGTVNSQDLNDALTVGELGRSSIPITTFSSVYIPEDNFDFWNSITIGDIVEVRADLTYDTIDAFYRLIGILSQPTDEADEQITLTFDSPLISL